MKLTTDNDFINLAYNLAIRLTFWFLDRDSFFAEILEYVKGSPTCRVVRCGVAPRRPRVQLGSAVQQQLDHVHVVVVVYNNNETTKNVFTSAGFTIRHIKQIVKGWLTKVKNDEIGVYKTNNKGNMQ